MSWVAAAVVGGAVVGGVLQSQGAKDAAGVQAGASRDASAVSMAQYTQQREDLAPWRQAGVNALASMENPEFGKKFTMADYQSDPGYDYRLDEGNKAINAAASARGMANSGATMKALTAYGQNIASEEYSKAYDRYNNDTSTKFNRLATLAGVGQTANGQVGAAGQNAANSVSNNIMGAANANSAATMASVNAQSNMIGQGVNAYANYQTMGLLTGKKV